MNIFYVKKSFVRETPGLQLFKNEPFYTKNCSDFHTE